MASKNCCSHSEEHSELLIGERARCTSWYEAGLWPLENGQIKGAVVIVEDRG